MSNTTPPFHFLFWDVTTSAPKKTLDPEKAYKVAADSWPVACRMAANYFRDAKDYQHNVRIVAHRTEGGVARFAKVEYEVEHVLRLDCISESSLEGITLTTEDPNGPGLFNVYEVTVVMGVACRNIICRDLTAVSPKDAAGHAAKMRAHSPLKSGTLHVLVVNRKTKNGIRFDFKVEQKTTVAPLGATEVGVPLGVFEDLP